MLLSRNAIKRHIEQKTIVISPFKEENLGGCSYDVTLGRNYYREQQPHGGQTVFNPFSEKEVERIWGAGDDFSEAQPLWSWLKEYGPCPILEEGIGSDELIIMLDPGESILANTEEFIGARLSANSEMKARSGVGRSFLTVCRCAGWGDPGYINRWTMEITNNSRFYKIPLVVGRRYAQMVFFEIEPVDPDYDYSRRGKYQTSFDLEETIRNWHPRDMLPKMWKDREIHPS